MRPLIVSATHDEIALSIPFLEKNNISYLITGVGMVATTYALTKYLSTQSCTYILNVGIAGAIDRKINLGMTVEVTKDRFSELGAEDDTNFLTIEDLGFGQSQYNKTNPTAVDLKLPTYEGITVNTVHGTENSVINVKKLFPNAAIESMEGAAIFYVATQFKIPALQVRSISNYVEKRDKSTWDIPLAIKNLNTWLIGYLVNTY